MWNINSYLVWIHWNTTSTLLNQGWMGKLTRPRIFVVDKCPFPLVKQKVESAMLVDIIPIQYNRVQLSPFRWLTHIKSSQSLTNIVFLQSSPAFVWMGHIVGGSREGWGHHSRGRSWVLGWAFCPPVSALGLKLDPILELYNWPPGIGSPFDQILFSCVILNQGMMQALVVKDFYQYALSSFQHQLPCQC